MDVFDNSVIEVLENTAEQLMKESVELREKDQLYSYGKFMFSEAARKAANILKEVNGKENRSCLCEKEPEYDDVGDWDGEKNSIVVFHDSTDLAEFPTPYETLVDYDVDDRGLSIGIYTDAGLFSIYPKYCPLCGRKLREKQLVFKGDMEI